MLKFLCCYSECSNSRWPDPFGPGIWAPIATICLLYGVGPFWWCEWQRLPVCLVTWWHSKFLWTGNICFHPIPPRISVARPSGFSATYRFIPTSSWHVETYRWVLCKEMCSNKVCHYVQCSKQVCVSNSASGWYWRSAWLDSDYSE